LKLAAVLADNVIERVAPSQLHTPHCRMGVCMMELSDARGIGHPNALAMSPTLSLAVRLLLLPTLMHGQPLADFVWGRRGGVEVAVHAGGSDRLSSLVEVTADALACVLRRE
jgi:hypothetical protein